MRLIVALALVLLPGSVVPADPQAGPRVGVGDSRAGYDRPDFHTDSRRLPTIEALQTDLDRLREPGVGLPAVPGAQDLTADRVTLGRKLFFDRRLSFNGVLSCAMCHVPEQGFAQNELATPVGTEGRVVKRNAPSLYNVAYRPRLFHDGREVSLENQVWAPLLAFNEMANPSVGSVLERLAGFPDYDGAFEAAFGRGPTMETLGAALASYERTLISGDSAFDRYYFGGEPQALTSTAALGFEVFNRAGCAGCHLVGPEHAQFTDELFHDTGIGYGNAHQLRATTRRVSIAPGVQIEVDTAPPLADLGRYEATGVTSDRWRFRTPSLRNVALTGPYMHDGSLADLEAVIDYYQSGGIPHPGQDPRIRPLDLDAEERSALLEFLDSLTGANVDSLAAEARSTEIGDY